MSAVEPRRTKIVATIGPASANKQTIEALIRAGMDSARLNFSHGTHEQHAETVEAAPRGAGGSPPPARADRRPPGPEAPDRRPVERRSRSSAARRSSIVGEDGATDGDLPVSPAVIGDVLRPGHEVLIDDGHVRLLVREVKKGSASCTVMVGGPVSSHKGVNLPGVPIPIPALTRKDTEDLEFALGLGVDFVALSFVRSAADVAALRALISQADSHGARDREDREVRGDRRARRDPRGVRTR